MNAKNDRARTRPECVIRFSSVSRDAGAGAVRAELTRARTRVKYVKRAMAVIFRWREGVEDSLSRAEKTFMKAQYQHHDSANGGVRAGVRPRLKVHTT